MEHRIRIDPTIRLIRAELMGEATVQGFYAYISELLSAPCRDVDYPVLTDVRRLDMHGLTSSNVREVVNYVSHKGTEVLPVKHAFVALQPLSFGLLRMYQLLARDRDPQNLHVFDSTEEAERWLFE